MFKPLHVTQVAILALLISGCAARQVTPASLAQAPAATPAAGANETRQAGSKLLLTHDPETQYPSIGAGRSVPGNQPWANANGTLNADVQAYAQEVAQTRGLPLQHVQALLQEAQFNADAARLMAPSKTRIRRSWVTYKKRFVEPIRINAGERFWREHRQVLDQTSQRYGVPPSIIVAIIGVETIYGRYTGNFRVLDALATLGFRYPDPGRPERSQLFRDQLADLIQLDYLGKLDARSVTGSFAGAMGLPQFMPGSFMRYAADGNHDGRIDLHDSTEDAIASVARFLRLHGWQPGLPVFAPVTLPRQPQALVDGGLTPNLGWEQLARNGATEKPVSVQSPNPETGGWKMHKLGMVNLVDEPRNQVEYRVGTPNFFAITQYNRSYFYAASVADLARALSDRMGYGGPGAW